MQCATCGGPTNFVEQYQQHWCDQCKQYATASKKGVNLWLVVGLPVVAVMILFAFLIFRSAGEFKGYIKKSQTTEARANLRALSFAVKGYYHQEHVAEGSMMVVTNTLPGPNAGPTPPLGTCCAQGGQCRPSLDQQWSWDAPVWQALGFSIDEAHYYSYEYRLSDESETYTVSAYGDLDCDGTYSTFSTTGQIADPGELGAIDLITIEDELE